MGSEGSGHPAGSTGLLRAVSGAGGLFAAWGRTCPLRFTSPNAPSLADLLGTITPAILAGQNRYAHVTGLRADTVNPQGLGMGKVCSEDSGRRALANTEPHSRDNLWRVWEQLPQEHRPWLVGGDAGFGRESLMSDCETGGQEYLFRRRRSVGLQQLLHAAGAARRLTAGSQRPERTGRPAPVDRLEWPTPGRAVRRRNDRERR